MISTSSGKFIALNSYEVSVPRFNSSSMKKPPQGPMKRPALQATTRQTLSCVNEVLYCIDVCSSAY